MTSRIWEEIRKDPEEYGFRCFMAGIVLAVLGGIVALFIFYTLAMTLIVGGVIVAAVLIMLGGALTYKIDEWTERRK